MLKTNVMRILESLNIPFQSREYEVDENDLSGVHMAARTGLPPEQVFKTLVLKGEKNGYFVCCIPCDQELDLKKAAKAAKDKKAEMLHVKDLKNVTGYIRGGCSPIGMKKKFPTFVDETAVLFDHIFVSAGVRGAMIRIQPDDLCRSVDAVFADLCK